MNKEADGLEERAEFARTNPQEAGFWIAELEGRANGL
jgi:hypothetical protein